MNYKTKKALRFGVSALIVLLAACDIPKAPEYDTPDMKLRSDLFFKCLKMAPAGPVATKYNDWSEVVEQCGDEARRLTYVCVKYCR